MTASEKNQARSAYIRPDPELIPSELKALDRWVLWRAELKDGKWTKPPYQANGRPAKSNNPATWASFTKAWEAYQDERGRFEGVGLVLDGDGLVGVDLDHVVDDAGSIGGPAAAVVRTLSSYTEVSPSGAGLRVFCRGQLPPGGRKKGQFEFYETRRYLTVTGRTFGDPVPIAERTAELAQVHAEIFKARPGTGPRPTPVASEPWRERIDRALRSRSGVDIQRLWEGTNSGDLSADDLALCSHLAFWLDGDTTAMDAAFRASGRMRRKWDEKHYADGRTYGQATIQKAVEGCISFFKDGLRAILGGHKQTADQGQVPAIPEHLTDAGNGELFASQHRGRVRFCHAWGKWLLWDGTKWATDESGQVVQLAIQTARGIFRAAANIQDPQEGLVIAKHAAKTESEPRLKAMLSLAESDLGIHVGVDELDADPWLFNCRNGTIDLRTGQLRLHDREDLITKISPAKYIPETRPELFLKILCRAMAYDPGLIVYLHKLFGYCLTGLTLEQFINLFFGSGANSKSTIIESVRYVLGDYARQTTFDTFLERQNEGIRNDLARLKGARLVTGIEMEQGRKLAEAVMKQLTGGDTITARFLHREHFEFRPTFKIILAANHKPIIRGTDYALWRRVRLVPFTVSIPEAEQDKNLAEKLRAEADAILAWLVEGCLLWQREGLEPPDAVCAATSTYKDESDVLFEFIEDRCETGPLFQVSNAALYEAYTLWASDNHERALSKKGFTNRLSERGFVRGRSAGGRYWIGVRLLQ